eukprot:GHVO01001216.1.p1 GENE.GHVO01001216.1~~GHVO01001216.1.p1  ORF type:complete len:176 (+),score=27.22 GHVO01001216.1:35-529(+)
MASATEVSDGFVSRGWVMALIDEGKSEAAITDHLQSTYPAYATCNQSSLHGKCRDLVKAVRQKRRSKKDLEEFLEGSLAPPKAKVTQQPDSEELHCLRQENGALKKKAETSAVRLEKLQLGLKASVEKMDQLKEEWSDAFAKIDLLEKKGGRNLKRCKRSWKNR